MLHILTIGANLIAQSRTDSYPVRIACTVNVGGTLKAMEAVGLPRLPYLSAPRACPVGVSNSRRRQLAPGSKPVGPVPGYMGPHRSECR